MTANALEMAQIQWSPSYGVSLMNGKSRCKTELYGGDYRYLDKVTKIWLISERQMVRWTAVFHVLPLNCMGRSNYMFPSLNQAAHQIEQCYAHRHTNCPVICPICWRLLLHIRLNTVFFSMDHINGISIKNKNFIAVVVIRKVAFFVNLYYTIIECRPM